MGVPRAEVSTLIAAITSAQQTPLQGYSAAVIAAARDGVRWGYSDAFRLTWLAAIPFGVIACVIAYFVTDVSPYFTSRTAVTLEREHVGGKMVEVKEEKLSSEV